MLDCSIVGCLLKTGLAQVFLAATELRQKDTLKTDKGRRGGLLHQKKLGKGNHTKGISKILLSEGVEWQGRDIEKLPVRGLTLMKP